MLALRADLLHVFEFRNNVRVGNAFREREDLHAVSGHGRDLLHLPSITVATRPQFRHEMVPVHKLSTQTLA